MIDVKEAVEIAKEKALEMFDEPAIRLEEIDRETHKGQPVWSITLSFPPDSRRSKNSWATPTLSQLEYKRFLISTKTGDLVAVKLREVATR
jgi:hypothetical protein